jgi:hypothetical protein
MAEIAFADARLEPAGDPRVNKELDEGAHGRDGEGKMSELRGDLRRMYNVEA